MANLDEIHEILQTAVGWRDSHLHSFTDTDPYVSLRAVNGHVREPRRWVSQDLLEDGDEDLPETDWTPGQILTAESGPLFYEYEFGDGWIHRLELTGSVPVPANGPRARLLDGARRAPLEDSGGIGGYHDLLDALADPGREEHKDLKAWVAWTAWPWQEFDPEQPDINAVNNELDLLFPSPSANEPGGGSESLTPGTHEPDASRPATRIPFIPARRRPGRRPRNGRSRRRRGDDGTLSLAHPPHRA